MTPLFWISLAFLIGILAGKQLTLPVSIWMALALTSLSLAGLWRFLKRSTVLQGQARALSILPFFLTSFFLGAARLQAAIPTITAHDLAWYNDRQYEVRITGWVTAPPDRRDRYANLIVRAVSIDAGNEGNLPVDGLLLARIQPHEEYEYGQMMRLRGRLQTPPEEEGFSYREYLARRGVHSFLPNPKITLLPEQRGNPFMAAIHRLRQYALSVLHRIFPNPEASLLAGILLGLDDGLPEDLQQAFRDTGTAHIIAISGFNISIITAVLLALFGRLMNQWRSMVLAALGVGVYTLLVGADAAVVRAAIMGWLGLLARYFGRQQDGLLALLVAAAAMNLYQPYYVYDVGFQLSFFATLGLILYVQPLESWTIRLLTRFKPLSPEPDSPPAPHIARLASLISNLFLVTFAAQVTTFPIMAYHFNRISLVSLIANPFILPAQPAVMILGGLANLLGMILLPLGRLFAWIAWPFVAYTIRMVDLFTQLPNAAIALDFPFYGVLLWFTLLFGLTLGRNPLKQLLVRVRLPRLPIWGILAGLLLVASLVWRSILALPDGNLHLILLNVGTADAILIQTPLGSNLLINGGEQLSQLSRQLGERLPLLHRQLDWLIIASTQENQVKALPRLIDYYPPRRVLWSGNIEASYASRILHARLIDRQIPIIQATTGQKLDLGDGATLTILHADQRGAVLWIEYKRFRALLPIGMSLDALTELQADPSLPPLTALLLADSGWVTLNPPTWIASLRPQIILLSVSTENRFGLPDPETLEAVQEYTVLRTDVHGWIELVSDGTTVWVNVERRLASATPSPGPAEEVELPELPQESLEEGSVQP